MSKFDLAERVHLFLHGVPEAPLPPQPEPSITLRGLQCLSRYVGFDLVDLVDQAKAKIFGDEDEAEKLEDQARETETTAQKTFEAELARLNEQRLASMNSALTMRGHASELRHGAITVAGILEDLGLGGNE